MLCQHGAETQAPATLVSLREAELAREQARVAQREAERALAVKAFLRGVFRSNTDQQADPLRARQATARDLLDEGARRIGDSLRSSPETQAAHALSLPPRTQMQPTIRCGRSHVSAVERYSMKRVSTRRQRRSKPPSRSFARTGRDPFHARSSCR